MSEIELIKRLIKMVEEKKVTAVDRTAYSEWASLLLDMTLAVSRYNRRHLKLISENPEPPDVA